MHDLSPEEVRVLGCLLEKQRTTPDTYPLTLNALRAACNQSTNRDPVLAYDEETIRDALDRLGRRRFTRLTSYHGSRAAKFRHLLDEALQIGPDDQAVLAVMMLRGPQTPGELIQRTERLHRFADMAALHAVIDRLTERELVARYDRRPGQREDRYGHLLGDEAEEQPSSAPPPPRPVVVAAAPRDDDRLDRLERELAELRAEVAALREELGRVMRSRTVETDRLRTHLMEAGPEDGIPVVLLHGNLSTGRFYAHLEPPAGYRLIAPDMRGFGDSERKPIDATRGLRDWTDDTHALVRALGIERPIHIGGWSTGGAAAAHYAMERPVTSLTLIDPVSPYGFGGTRADGTPCWPDYAGSGGGVASPDLVERLAAGDRSIEATTSPRSVMTSSYWSPNHNEPREEELLDELLKSAIGDDFYPGDLTPSDNWPGVAPGTRGIINALSPRYCDWSGLADLDSKPPILWTYGSEDVVISDTSAWDFLGQAGHVPGWPGEDAHPPQPMVSQTAALLERCGDVRVERFEGSGHFPPIDAAERWSQVFFGFLEDAER